MSATRIFESEFPYTFAVVRTQSSPDPIFQFLDAPFSRARHEVPGVRKVENASSYPQMEGAEWQEIEDEVDYDPEIYTLAVAGRDQVRYFHYWYLPFYFPRNGTRLPVIKFQYESWLPSPRIHGRDHVNTPVTRLSLFMRSYQSINREREARLRERENRNAYETPPAQRIMRRTSPPRILRVRGTLGSDEAAAIQGILSLPLEDMQFDVRPARFPNLHVDIPTPPSDEMLTLEDLGHDITPPLPLAFREHDEDQMPRATALRPIMLPKHVGDLLIQEARAGTECCPITAMSYSECMRLSVTSCFHVFEHQSLQRWQSEDHTTCPVCRTHITNVVTE